MKDSTRKHLELRYKHSCVQRSGDAIFGDEKTNQLFVRVIDKSGEVRLIESLNVVLNDTLRKEVEHLDAWVVQVGGTEKFNLVNLNKEGKSEQ